MSEQYPAVLSEPALHALVGRARPLWERVRDGTPAPGDPTEACGRPEEAGGEAAALIRTWRSILKCDDIGGLERRLELDSTTCGQVVALLQADPTEPLRPLPQWALILNRILAACLPAGIQGCSWPAHPAEDRRHGTAAEAPRPDPSPPFSELFSPFIESALGLLGAKHERSIAEALAPEAIACLEASLRQQLSELCSFALEFEFTRHRRAQDEPAKDGADVQYRAFVRGLLQGGLAGFFEEYPVLGRLVGIAVERWAEAMAEFLSRLEGDRGALEALFHDGKALGRLRKIAPNLSDLHERGRRVIVLQFETGVSLAYKPRSVDLDRAFYALLQWMNERSAQPPLYVPRCLARASHGWVEFIERLDCSSEAELRRFYRRCGMLLSLVSVLRGTDFHYGNVIAHGDHPVLIDLETLFAGRLFGADPDEAEAHAAPLLEVLRTGLLPNYQVGPKDHVFDVSGLAGRGGQQTGFTVPDWVATNNDTMRLARRIGTTSAHDNLPRLDGRNASPAEYQGDLVAGFREMGASIIEHASELLAPGGPIEAFRGLPARFVFRPTSLYHLLLRGTLSPDFLRRGAQRSVQLDTLARFLIRREGHQRLWPLSRIELEAMEDGEVPFFRAHTDRTHVTALGRQLVGDVLEGSSYEAVRTWIAELRAPAIADQVEVVNWALSGHAIDRCPGQLAPGRSAGQDPTLHVSQDAPLLRAAQAIATQLVEQALHCHSGPTWFGPEFTEEAHRQSIRPTGSDLHGGTPGIAVFFAALWRVRGGAFGALALRALDASRHRMHRSSTSGGITASALGGTLGSASLLYAWTLVGTLLGDESLVDEAVTCARAMDPRAFPVDAPTGVVRGLSGTLLCLLAVHERSGDRCVLERAEMIGRILLDRRLRTTEGPRVWQTRHGQFLTGFAHGSSGIAFSLLRLYDAVRHAAYLDAAVEAIEFESSGFDPERNAWPDLRFSPGTSATAFANAWCHGASGIALLRLEALRHEHRESWLRDVDTAVARIKDETSPLDQLCCGHAGRAELLVEAARRLDRPALQEAAREVAVALLERAERRGKFCLATRGGLSNPGLFLGTAGIGYQLLRIAFPGTVPSLLTWKVPT